MSSATPTGSRSVATPSFVHHRHRTDDEPHDSLSESYSSLDDTSSDDDEIVYSISDLSVISVPRSSGSVDELSDADDDDFVLLSLRCAGRRDSRFRGDAQLFFSQSKNF